MNGIYLRRSIECRDVGGRRNVLRIYAEPGAIFVNAPAGEVALVQPNRIEELKSALTDALVVALRDQTQ